MSASGFELEKELQMDSRNPPPLPCPWESIAATPAASCGRDGQQLPLRCCYFPSLVASPPRQAAQGCKALQPITAARPPRTQWQSRPGAAPAMVGV